MIYRVLLLCAFCGAVATCSAQTPIKVEFATDSDPKLTDPGTVRVLSKSYIKVWLTLLDPKSEQDLLRRTAAAIERAQEFELAGLEVTVDPLTNVMTATSSSPAVRYAAARALIALKAKGSAAALLDVSQQTGLDMRQLVEPTLAEWDFAPARSIWSARLTDSSVRHRDLLLAIRCLGRVKDESSAPRLREMLLDSKRPMDLRLDAADALGQIKSEGLEADSEKLASDPQRTQNSVTQRVCAVRILRQHKSDVARSRLITFASDSDSAVAGAAMHLMVEIDPTMMLPFVQAALKHTDLQIRRAAFDVCVLLPTVERIEWIAPLLDDVNPGLRGTARDTLFHLAQRPEFAEVVRTTAMQQLAAGGWRGQEQAALLLAALDHEPAAARLVALLKSPRPEVMVSAAWSLRKLAVRETLAPMLAHAQELFSKGPTLGGGEGADQQLGHVCEAFGVMKYADANGFLMSLVPKGTSGEMSRSSAVWALGKLHEGKFDEVLATKLLERLLDVAAPNPESNRVRMAAAITLARIDSKPLSPQMRKLLDPIAGSSVDLAVRWAVMKLSGEDVPEFPEHKIGLGFSFAEPAIRASATTQ